VILLLAFIGGIANALRSGRQPDCHCFGQIHSTPAGRGTIARNIALVALAAIVLGWGSGPTVEGWTAARSAAELTAVGLGALAFALGALSLNLWLDNRRLRHTSDGSAAAPPESLPELDVGGTAPRFSLPDLRGELVSLEELCALGRPVALVFVDPDCGPCQSLFPELGRWQATLSDTLTIALLSSGTVDQNRPTAEDHGVVNILLQERSEVREAYGAVATPSALTLTPEGLVASELAKGSVAIEALIRLTLRQPPAARPVAVS
jgi:peroxiredoxin